MYSDRASLNSATEASRKTYLYDDGY